MPGQARTPSPIASGFTRVAACAIGFAAIAGYGIGRIILRGD